MKAYTALLALASAVNAHMIMRSPTPFNTPNSSPVDGTGADFPCKIPGGSGDVSSGTPNQLSVGTPFQLAFTGSAVHGGGSCQVSLAKGTAITKDTKFMVIHSIEGGCPGVGDNGGNFAADPSSTSDANTYSVTVPDHPDLPAGDYTLAWTWNNKIGNREFYMNCAYVKLSGASKKRYAPSNMPISKRADGPLPDMFVANIGNGCTVAEGSDVKYPNPGSSVEVASGATLKDPVGSCGASGSDAAATTAAAGGAATTAASGGAASSVAAGGAASSSAPASANTVVPSSAAAGNGSGTRTQSVGGGFATESGGSAATSSAASVATSAASIATSAASATQAASSAVASTKASSAPAAGSTGTSTGTSSGGTAPMTPCTEEGDWLCLGSSFQRCASGLWSTPISLGSQCCDKSQTKTLTYTTCANAKAKRDLKSHIAHRRHNLAGNFFS